MRDDRPDDIRRLSDELARDPTSRVFMELGERLRRLGQSELALKVVLRGLERHPYDPDAHDLLARIFADRGDAQRAADEWHTVLRLSPKHTGARKGLGFLCFQQEQYEDAVRYLAEAAEAEPEDQSIAAALALVRRARGVLHDEGEAVVSLDPDDEMRTERRARAHREATALGAASGFADVGDEGEITEELPVSAAPVAAADVSAVESRTPSHDPRALFADLLTDGDQAALLLDASGLVLAGAFLSDSGLDVAQEIGAQLSGVSDEALRAMRHLEMGDWQAIVVETQSRIVGMAPGPDDGLVLVAARAEIPLGLVRRQLTRAAATARAWMAGQG